jgi:hypothetical protein
VQRLLLSGKVLGKVPLVLGDERDKAPPCATDDGARVIVSAIDGTGVSLDVKSLATSSLAKGTAPRCQSGRGSTHRGRDLRALLSLSQHKVPSIEDKVRPAVVLKDGASTVTVSFKEAGSPVPTVRTSAGTSFTLGSAETYGTTYDGRLSIAFVAGKLWVLRGPDGSYGGEAFDASTGRSLYHFDDHLKELEEKGGRVYARTTGMRYYYETLTIFDAASLKPLVVFKG